MAKKLLLVLASIHIYLIQPCFAQTTDVDPDLAKRCIHEQLEIQVLKNDREKMAFEIRRLQDDIRNLNETINRIRSQIGDDRPRPTRY